MNVANTHSVASPNRVGEIPAELVPLSLTKGLGLVYLVRDTEHEDRMKVDVVVDVCFRDPELDSASPGYGSAFETAGTINRPSVIPVRESCLAAVVNAVEQLTGETLGGGVSHWLRYDHL